MEDTFLVTHPPNSHLFPVRQRSNSSPAARPSSLSRLLAQASPAQEITTEAPAEHPADLQRTPSPATPTPAPEIRSLSPPASSPPPPSQSPSVPVPQNVSPNANNNTSSNTPSMPSPLRPGSRASRLSTTSRFSVSRIPALGAVMTSQSKAAATTALTEQAIAASPSSITDSPFRSPVTPPPPEEAISDAVTNALSSQLNTTVNHRRRTSSHQTTRPSPLATTSTQGAVAAATIVPARPSFSTTNTLTNLASSWGMSFGRKKKAEIGSLAPTAEASGTGSDREPPIPETPNSSQSARELLKRF